LLLFLAGVPFLGLVCFFEEVFFKAFFLDVGAFLDFLFGEGFEKEEFDEDQ